MIEADRYPNMNIATDENYSIDKIAKIALKVCDAEHLKIKYNSNRPNGQMRKDIDTAIFEKNFPNRSQVYRHNLLIQTKYVVFPKYFTIVNTHF